MLDKIVIDRIDDKDVLISKEYESLYLRLKVYLDLELEHFKQFYTIKHDDVLIIDELTMIEKLIELMTLVDLLYIKATFESVHKLYIKNFMLLYKLTDNHDIFDSINVLNEVKKLYMKEVE